MRHNNQLWYESMFGVDYVDTLDAPSAAISSEGNIVSYEEVSSDFDDESLEDEAY